MTLSSYHRTFFYIFIVPIRDHIYTYALSQPNLASSSVVREHENLRNLNAIVGHIQNPELYFPTWANFIDFKDAEHENDLETQFQLPVANCKLLTGDVVALHPVQYISYDRQHNNGLDVTVKVDLLDEERYPYPCIRNGISKIYIHSDNRQHIGWYGNIIPTSKSSKNANCAIVPLPGAAPICAMVATRAIEKGEVIIRQKPQSSDDEITRIYAQDIAKRYANEIGELILYLDMACGAGATSRIETTSGRRIQEQKYHPINKSFPNLEKIHSDPDIYAISDFLSNDECERIIEKVARNMQPCLVKNAETGNVEPDPSRTSTNANIPRKEVPSVTKKILQVANCEEEQMEILQVLHYKDGQEFRAHTDGFQGPTSACGFLQSGRIMTLFCYLNDVEDGKGGTTLFPQLNLEITPRRGLAIIHFPMSLDLVEDERTEHQGSIAIDDKWILTTWIWKNFRADARYSEETLLSLSGDII